MENTDKLTSRGAIIAFLFPPIGIVNYFRNKESKPNTAKASAKIAMFSLAILGAGKIADVIKKRNQSLDGFDYKLEADWLSEMITIPEAKIKIKVPFGPRNIKKVFIEVIDGEFIITDENGMIINF